MPPALNMPEPEGALALGHSFSEQSPASVACQPLSHRHVPSPLSHSPWPEQMSDCEEGANEEGADRRNEWRGHGGVNEGAKRVEC